MEKELATNAWLKSGFFSYTQGVLYLSNNIISFISEKGEEFTVPLSEVKNVKWPTMQLGYGVYLEISGKKYKLSLSNPTGKDTYYDKFSFRKVGTSLRLMSDIKGFSQANKQLKDYKVAAKEWREILGG